MEQLKKPLDVVHSHRGLSLDDLCRQLGHYNMKIRRDAVVGLRQLLSANPELITNELHIIIASVSRRISSDVSVSQL